MDAFARGANLRRGVTLLEVLAVVAIIALLAGLAVPSALTQLESQSAAKQSLTVYEFGREAVSMSKGRGVPVRLSIVQTGQQATLQLSAADPTQPAFSSAHCGPSQTFVVVRTVVIEGKSPFVLTLEVQDHGGTWSAVNDVSGCITPNGKTRFVSGPYSGNGMQIMLKDPNRADAAKSVTVIGGQVNIR